MTISPSYVSFGPIELYREDQFAAWHRNLCIGGSLRPAEADTSALGCPRPVGGWTLPQVDGAWWCYTGAPEAGEVAGLLITEVDGLDVSTYRRETIDLAACGSTFGRPTTSGRTIVVKGQIRAKTCSGLSYFVRALDYQLRNACTEGCAGADFRFLDCAPADGTPAPEVERLERFIPNVVLTSGLSIVKRWSTGCCSTCTGNIAEVTFTLGAPGDDIFLPAYEASGGTCAQGAEQSFTLDSFCKLWRWVPPDGLCGGTVAATWDEDCFPVPARPTRVTSLLTCACEAIAYTFGSCEITNPHPWAPMSLRIEVLSGSAPIRGWRVKAFRLPDWLPCPSTEADIRDVEANYDPEVSLVIPSLPAGARVVLDATRGQYEVAAFGRVMNARRYVYGGGGKPFRMPIIDPCDRVCLVVQANGCEDVSTARWSVSGMAAVTMAGGAGRGHPGSTGLFGGSSAALTLGRGAGALSNRMNGSAGAVVLGRGSGSFS